MKNIIKKCSDDNICNSGSKIGLLEYLCIPISDSIRSPAELLNIRVYKDFQPFLEPTLSSFQITKDTVTDNLISLKEKEKINHDKQAIYLSKMMYGTMIIIRIFRKKVLLQNEIKMTGALHSGE